MHKSQISSSKGLKLSFRDPKSCFYVLRAVTDILPTKFRVSSNLQASRCAELRFRSSSDFQENRASKLSTLTSSSSFLLRSHSTRSSYHPISGKKTNLPGLLISSRSPNPSLQVAIPKQDKVGSNLYSFFDPLSLLNSFRASPSNNLRKPPNPLHVRFRKCSHEISQHQSIFFITFKFWFSGCKVGGDGWISRLCEWFGGYVLSLKVQQWRSLIPR